MFAIPIFKQVGMQMILFAKEEPQLYQLVFMSQNSDVKFFADIYSHLGSVANECLDTIMLTFAESGGIAGVPIDHSFLKYKKELMEYGWEVGKSSMKVQTALFIKAKKDT